MKKGVTEDDANRLVDTVQEHVNHIIRYSVAHGRMSDIWDRLYLFRVVQKVEHLLGLGEPLPIARNQLRDDSMSLLNRKSDVLVILEEAKKCLEEIGGWNEDTWPIFAIFRVSLHHAVEALHS